MATLCSRSPRPSAMLCWLALAALIIASGCASGSGSSDSSTSSAGNLQGPGGQQVTAVDLLIFSVPATDTIAVGDSVSFTALATMSDGSTQDVSSSASWNSSAPGVASFSLTGVLTGLSQGATNVTADYSGLTSNVLAMNVVPPSADVLTISASTTVLNVGDTADVTALLSFSDGSTTDVTSSVTWQSSNTGIVSIAGGTPATATAVAPGLAGLTAQYEGLNSNQISMLVLDSSGTNDFTPVITASRTSGNEIVPVFFDALQTVLPNGTKHDAYYFWDFDDPNSSHPSAKGFCAAHVFEGAGTYTVTLYVVDNQGYTGQASVAVTVSSFPGPTYYVAANGSDGNNGQSTSAPFQSLSHAMSVLTSQVPTNGTPTAGRVLFRRGDTFNTSGYNLGGGRHGDPIIIGAYGTGAKPVIHNTTSNNNTFSLGAGSEGWYFVDLDLSGTYNINVGGSPTNAAISNYIGGDHMAYRCDMHDIGKGFMEGGGSQSDRHDVFLVDCNIHDVYDYGSYIGAERLAAIGNDIERSSISHMLRVWSAYKGVVSDNVLADGSVNNNGQTAALKMHAGPFDTGGLPTANVIVSGNTFRGGLWPIEIAPQNDHVNEEIRDVVFEDNIATPSPTMPQLTMQSLTLSAHDVTIRNNIFVGDRDGWTAISAFTRSSSSPPIHDIRVMNNTAYQAGGGVTNGRFLYVGVPSVVISNNVFSSPSASSSPTACVDISGGVSLSTVDSHNNIAYFSGYSIFARYGGQNYNLSSWQGMGQGSASLMADPMFEDVSADDFQLLSGSPAATGGTSMPGVFDDYFGNARPAAGPISCGAIEVNVQ